MITKNYIVKSDIPLTGTVTNEKVTQYIPDALTQLRETLPPTLYADLQAIYDESVKDWSKNNSYVVNDRAVEPEYGEAKMWRSLTANTNSKPTTVNTTDWDELDLGTLLVGFVQPFLAYHVFYAYAVNGGVNVTHQGLQTISNETAQPLSGSGLQSFLNYWKKRTENHKRRMFNYLDEKRNVFDGTSYTAVESDRKKPRFQIRAIGRNTMGINSSIDI